MTATKSIDIQIERHTDEVFKYELWHYNLDDKTIRKDGSDDKITRTPVETYHLDPSITEEEFWQVVDHVQDQLESRTAKPVQLH